MKVVEVPHPGEVVFRPNELFLNRGISPIMALGEVARKMKANGEDVILLGAGEPDFDTPNHIKEAAKRALDRGETKYTPVHGTPQAKEAVRRKFEKDQGIRYSDAEIAIAAGAKQLLFNALMVSLSPGDEVIIPTPVWGSYPEIVKITGGVPILVPALPGGEFKITARQLEDAITQKTKWLMINTPSNPSGALYSREELEALANVLRRNPHVWILTDEIYEKLVFDGRPFTSFVQAAPDLAGRMLVVNGVSKAYAMTGWRVGFAGGPEPLIKAMSALQSQSTTNPCSIAQAATIAALEDSDEVVAAQCAEYQRRRDLVVSRLNNMPGIECATPGGAFYVLPSMAGLVGKKHAEGKILNDQDFCNYILNTAKVVIVPGYVFGAENNFRISFATSYELLEDAMDRIQAAIENLS